MKHVLIGLWLTLLMTGCASAPIGGPELLDFIQDGRTSREETYLRLGEPWATYDNAQMLTFRLGKDEGGYFLVEKAQGFVSVEYSLVLVFDEAGLLKQHSLVQLKTP